MTKRRPRSPPKAQIRPVARLAGSKTAIKRVVKNIEDLLGEPPPVPPMTLPPPVTPPAVDVPPLPFPEQGLMVQQPMKNLPEADRKVLVRSGYRVCGVNKALVLHKQVLAAVEKMGASKGDEEKAVKVTGDLEEIVKEVFGSKDVLKLGIIPNPHGLTVDDNLIITRVEGAMWSEATVGPGMRVISLNNTPITGPRHLYSLLPTTKPRGLLEVETNHEISNRTILGGSWATSTALKASTLDIIISASASPEWIQRLKTYLAMKGKHHVLSNSDSSASLEPSFLLEDIESGLVCSVHMTKEVPGLSHVWKWSNCSRRICQVVKLLNRAWGHLVQPHVINLLVASFDSLMYSHDLGWVTDCTSLGSALLGFLYWMGVAINWSRTTLVPPIVPSAQPALRAKQPSEPPFAVIDPFTAKAVPLDERFEAFLTYVARTAAVLRCDGRTLDHVLPMITRS